MKTRLIVAVLIVLCCIAWAAEDVVGGQETGVRVQNPTAAGREGAAGDGSYAITIPRLLSYQGKLTDTMGVPVADTLYAIRFRLYAQPTGGTQLWEENQNVRTAGGLFSVLLGSVTPIDTMPEVGTAYLAMSVSGGAELTPRLRIASAAYAYLSEHSANSDALQGRDTVHFDSRYVNESQSNSVTGSMLVSGAVTSAKIFDGEVNNADLAPGAVTGDKLNQMGAGTGQVLKWTGSTWAPRNDSVGGGGGGGTVTSVSQGTGVTCTPNPITTTGTVGLNTSYTDGRYVNATGDSMSGALAVSAPLRVYDKAVLGYSCYNSGAHAFCAGYGNNADGGRSSVTGGEDNTSDGDYAHVGGGSENRADALWSTIGGGNVNEATDTATTVGGGRSNFATASHAAVAGGYGNDALGRYSYVGGGYNNTADTGYATVGGGEVNTASGHWSTVAGGTYNTAGAIDAAVGGGYENEATGRAATVSGGDDNAASGIAATVGGGYRNIAAGNYSTVAGGQQDTAMGYAAGVLSGRGNLAGDAVTDTATVVAGGWGNRAMSIYAAVAGGYSNEATGGYSFVGGGLSNDATHLAATVAGGYDNEATGGYSSVGGGRGNGATQLAATVGGGYYNGATGYMSTVGGGDYNVASADYATVAGGHRDTASASHSFAANNNSDALHSNSAAFNGEATTASNQTRVGVLSKASGSFTIDHPLDPYGKILNHYFVEGPEMRNIYEGSVVLDGSGRAVVRLPDYFEALNRSPHVQLTGVGTFEVYVAKEVTGNRFTVGGKPGTKVFWTVTGERRDVSAEATRRMMPVEQPKRGPLAGRMLDDDFLVGCMEQLEREGKASGIGFRTAGGRQRYEKMKRLTEEPGR